MRNDVTDIILTAVKASDPYDNTLDILRNIFSGDEIINVMSIGKAAVPMAKACDEVFGDNIVSGLLVTKYGHGEGFSSEHFEVMEAGHPICDDNSILAAQRALEITKPLGEKDILLVLLSGGGSALFEKSRVLPEIQRDITEKLLSRGADIRKINAVRKRLSFVKGGRLSSMAYPAKVITIALSDVLSNDKSVIASGITVKDEETDEFVESVLDTYLPDIDDAVKKAILTKDEIKINDGGYYFAGDINILCDAAGKKACELGYSVFHGRRDISGEAKDEAVELINSIPVRKGKRCYIFGGESVVTLKGNGKGGRNQEMALSAAIALKNRKNIIFASVGSDGTDGPTDAAGGLCDGDTYDKIMSLGICPEDELNNNNSYYALKSADCLVMTGPTGTNVNDIVVILTE